MTELELRKLKRTELLEMLLEQSKENQSLKVQVEKLENQLASRMLHLEEAGNIAEASMRINGVFEAAQAAAKQYLDNVEMLADRQKNICAQKEADTEAKVTQLLNETQLKCEAQEKEVSERLAAMEQAVREKCAALEKETEDKCLALTTQAEQDVEARWENLSVRLEEFYKAHTGLRELLTAAGGIQRD